MGGVEMTFVGARPVGEQGSSDGRLDRRAELNFVACPVEAAGLLWGIRGGPEMERDL